MKEIENLKFRKSSHISNSALLGKKIKKYNLHGQYRKKAIALREILSRGILNLEKALGVICFVPNIERFDNIDEAAKVKILQFYQDSELILKQINVLIFFPKDPSNYILDNKKFSVLDLKILSPQKVYYGSTVHVSNQWHCLKR